MPESRRLDVRPVAGRREREAFIRLPFRLYRDDPHWVPPLIIAERDRLDPAKNPFFEHATMQTWIAWRGDTPAGRIAAIDDALHLRVHGDNAGFFGFLEAADEAGMRALLDVAEQWVRQRGRSCCRGPVSPSLNDTSGLLVEGFDDDPVLMMAYNPATYPVWIEAAGYAKAKDLWAWWFAAENSVNERTQRVLARIRRSLDPQPTLRDLSKRHLAADAAIMHRLFAAAWKENWGFVPPTDAEFQHAAKEMKAILDPRYGKIMELNGEPIAFSLTLPDVNQVLKRMNGRLFPTGLLKLLMRRRYINRSRMMLMGVHPDHRKKGLELWLIADSIRHLEALGHVGGECSWTLEDNEGVSKAIRLVGGERYKTYRIYEKPLQ